MRPETTRAIVVLPAPLRTEQGRRPCPRGPRTTRRTARGTVRSRRRRRAARAAVRPRSTVSVRRHRLAGRPCDGRRSLPASAISSATAISPRYARADRLVAHHLGGRAFGDQRAEVEHVEAPREGSHHLDVVLDEQDGRLPRALDLAAACAPAPAVSCWSSPDDGSSSSSSCGSVISARPTSTSRPRPRLSDSTGRSATSSRPSRSSVRSARSRSSPVGFDEVEAVLPEAPGAESRPLGDEQVVTHGHPTEELDALERAPDAEPGALVHRRRA